MFIPTWLLIVAGVAVWLLMARAKSQRGEARSVEGMWRLATLAKNSVLERSPLIHDYLQDERDMVTAMELDAMRLRERFKHDTIKQTEVARDWMQFAEAVKQVKHAREMLDVSSSDDSFETYGEKVNEPHICIQEIGQRFADMLGDQSHCGVVMKRLKQEAELPLGERMKVRQERRDGLE